MATTSTMIESLHRLTHEHEILQVLEESEVSTTYHVRHRLLGEERLARVWVTDRDEETGRQLVEAARTASRLVHPNIARVVDFSLEDDGRAWMLVEMVSGVDLRDVLLENAPLSPALVHQIGMQILRALAYVHGRGAPLPRLGPRSFVLTTSVDDGPLVKLLGAGELAGSGAANGAEQWSPPEGGTATVAGDLWVVGRLLTALHRAGGCRAPQAVAGVLRRATAPDPGHRWPSAGAMGRALTEAVGMTAGSSEEDDLGVSDLIARVLDRGRTRVLKIDESLLEESWVYTPPPAGAREEETLKLEPAETPPVEPELLAEARVARQEGDLDRAAIVLDRALVQRPGSRRLRRLRDEVENERRAAQDAGVRDHAIRSRRAEVVERLAAGDLEAAKARLAAGEEELGPDPKWDRLRAEIDAEEAERSAAVEGLFDRARQELARGNLREAELALDEAEAREPAHAELGPLRKVLTRKALQELDANRQPPSAAESAFDGDATLRQLLDRADHLVAEGALEEALEVLARARDAAPHHAAAENKHQTVSFMLSEVVRPSTKELEGRAPPSNEPGTPPGLPTPRAPGPPGAVGDLTLRGLGDAADAALDDPSLRVEGPVLPPVRASRRHRGGMTRIQWILLALLVAILSGFLGTRLAQLGSSEPTPTGTAVEEIAPPPL